MRHGQNRDDVITLLDGRAQHVAGKVVVRPQRTVGNHHTLREARGTAGIVDQGQLVRTLLDVIVDMLLTEVFRILLSIEGVQVLAGIGQLLRARHDERVVRIADDALQVRHLLRVDDASHIVAGKEQLRIRVVHDIMNLLGHEFVQDGHGNGTVGQRGDESHSPLAAVSSAECNLVTFLYA